MGRSNSSPRKLWLCRLLRPLFEPPKAPSFKGEGAKRSGLGDIERFNRRLTGRGGIEGTEGALSFSWFLAGRGGIAGVDCMVAAVMLNKAKMLGFLGGGFFFC